MRLRPWIYWSIDPPRWLRSTSGVYRRSYDDDGVRRRWQAWIIETTQLLDAAPPNAAFASDPECEGILAAMWRATLWGDHRQLVGLLRAYRAHMDAKSRP